MISNLGPSEEEEGKGIAPRGLDGRNHVT